jgi:hypothetical protein
MTKARFADIPAECLPRRTRPTPFAPPRRSADPRARGDAGVHEIGDAFLGVSAGPLRKACKAVFKDLPGRTASVAGRRARDLARRRVREERYARIELTGSRRQSVPRRSPRADVRGDDRHRRVVGLVDAIATQRLWAISQNEGEPMKSAMLAWSTDRNM